ncbi:MAG: HAMP domain-containing histidine kinase [Deltaproteobacteria bacterium]|nr:HAMP domain-containing histidine kinase [Deltaproteobacteria bacterium]
MRITLKLSLAVGLCILGILGANAMWRIQAEGALVRADIRRDHDVLGRVLSTGVELLLERGDLERANELVSAVNARESHMQIRWLRSGDSQRPVARDLDVAAAARAGMQSRVVEDDEGRSIVTYVGVDSSIGPSVIEVAEDLTSEAERVRAMILRTILTTLALLTACLLALSGVGQLLVGRPVARLRDHARRVGTGDLGARLASTSRDELGDLARETDAMTERLESMRGLAEREAAARAKALERLQHADRLRAVGEMASAVAHEIGTPLAIVRARAQQLDLHEMPRERVREVAAMVIGEVDRMSAIIRRLLAVSRRDVREMKDVVVARWAEETIALLEPLARGEGVRLELDVSEAERALSLEDGTLRQVVINLVMNAIQASPRGGRVKVRVAVEDEASLRIVVEDEGAGVPESLRAEIFEPFFTTKDAADGTGLGLSVAAGIVRQQGGTIALETREGGGASFVVCVPITVSALSAEGSTRRQLERT